VALVALGAGNINDTSQQTGAVVAALQRLDVEVCVTQTEIAESNRTHASVRAVRDFPLSRRFRAFDLGISAAVTVGGDGLNEVGRGVLRSYG
jgi:hypothetical protein